MTQTNYYPIAHCGATAQADAREYDQRWMIVDSNWGALHDQVQGKLSDISVSLKLGYLVIRAPGMLRLDVPLDVIEDDESVFATATVQGQSIQVVDEGELAAAWMSNYLEQPARLVKMHPEGVAASGEA
jgi:uncharacterized protein YcbX